MFIAGQSVLSAVVAFLAIIYPGADVPVAVLGALPMMVTVGAFTTASGFRRNASREPFTARDRGRAIVAMAGGQAISVIGVVIALVALFVGP